MVLTQNKLWSTVQADKPLNLLDLLNICSVRLIYLGNLHFGVLTWRPHLPKKVAVRSPGFNIIEEYTLDEPNTEDGSSQHKAEQVKQDSPQVHVSTNLPDRILPTETVDPATGSNSASSNEVDTTAANMESSLPVHSEATRSESEPLVSTQATLCDIDSIKSDVTEKHPQLSLPAETVKDHLNIVSNQAVQSDLLSNTDNTGLTGNKPVPAVLPVTCHEDALLLVHYPWKHALKIELNQIQPIEIDTWCNTVQDYYEFKIFKEITPVITEVKGYGLRARQIKSEPSTEDLKSDKTDQLIDQAQALIDTAKTFATKPVNRKHSRKRSTENSSKPDVKLKALDMLHEMTVNNLSTLHVGTDGTNLPSDSVPHTPKKRKIKCKMCSEIFGNVRELNVHHKKDHGIVKCPKCDKYFSTQSSLDKHSYSHGELKFNCDVCGKCFAFQS